MHSCIGALRSGASQCPTVFPSTASLPSHSSAVRRSRRAEASVPAKPQRRPQPMHDHRSFNDEEEPWSSGSPSSDTSDSPHYHSGAGHIYPCPSCQSPRTEPRHTARRIGGAVGAAAGATSAVAIALSGAEVGATAGFIGGPVGAACGGIAGAILAGLVAGAAGCATGAACGEALDLKVLNNWRCLACGRTFSVHPR